MYNQKPWIISKAFALLGRLTHFFRLAISKAKDKESNSSFVIFFQHKLTKKD